MPCATDLCNQGREACPTPWHCGKYGYPDGYLPAMHAPLQPQEQNEAQEAADPAPWTLASIVWPTVKFLSAIAAIGFIGYVLWAAGK